jgi:hypothetical protein
LFDGDNDYINIDDTGVIKTLSFWYKSNDVYNQQQLFPAGTYSSVVIGHHRASGYIGCYDGSRGGWSVKYLMPSQQWIHVVHVWSSTDNQYKQYINGVYNDLLNCGLGSTNKISGIGVNSINGSMKYIKIFDESITEKEIENLYNYNSLNIPSKFICKDKEGNVYSSNRVCPTEIDGDIKATGEIEGEKIGVYATLYEPDTTTITTAGTFYPIEGVFNNTIMEGFFYNMTANAIQYNSSTPRVLQYQWFAQVNGDTNGITVSVSTAKNGLVSNECIMSGYLKNFGQNYHLSNSCVYELQKGDQVQLVMSADGNGDLIEFDKFTAIAKEFFD